MSTLPNLAAIEAASTQVYKILSPTPQYRWPLLEAQFGAELWVKHENHTPTGSFKARTAAAYVAEQLQANPEIRCFFAATRGNHGQAVALAARANGRESVVVVPLGNSREKNAAMRAQGANLIEFGADFQAAKLHAIELSAAQNGHFVPSFHPSIVAAVASYWMELFRAVPNLDAAYVPVGQGSGICAALAARQALGLQTQIIGVISSHAPAYGLSLAQGESVEAPANTVLADGVACRVPEPASLALLMQHQIALRQVSDAEVASAMRMYFSATHNVVEGAGATALAAALKDRAGWRGKRVAVIACGANVDTEVFVKVLRGEFDEEHPGQIFPVL